MHSRGTLLLVLILMALPARPTQPTGSNAINLLRNSNANEGTRYWNAEGNATIEEVDGNPCFVLRRGGQFTQRVSISEGHEDLYVVFVGRVSTEYVHPDGAITDRPHLYGMAFGESDRIILGYFQGQTMGARSGSADEWETVYGIFHAPEGTTQVWFELGQGLRRGVPYSGAAARFDDVALYAVTDESAARAVAARHVPDARITVGIVTLPVKRPPR